MSARSSGRHASELARMTRLMERSQQPIGTLDTHGSAWKGAQQSTSTARRPGRRLAPPGQKPAQVERLALSRTEKRKKPSSAGGPHRQKDKVDPRGSNRNRGELVQQYHLALSATPTRATRPTDLPMGKCSPEQTSFAPKNAHFQRLH